MAIFPCSIFYFQKKRSLRRSRPSGPTPVPGAKDFLKFFSGSPPLPSRHQCSHDVAYHMFQKSIGFDGEAEENLFLYRPFCLKNLPYRVNGFWIGRLETRKNLPSC